MVKVIPNFNHLFLKMDNIFLYLKSSILKNYISTYTSFTVVVNKQLENYVREQLKRGYSVFDIRSYLLRYGYKVQEVDEAIRSASKPKLHAFVLVLVVISVIGLVAGGVIFIVSLGEEVEEQPLQLLDVEVEGLQKTLRAGDLLGFNVELVNLGARRRYDVQLEHRIFDAQDRPVSGVLEGEEFAIETRASKKSEIVLPEDLTAGDYTLKTTAKYNGQDAEAFFSFSVAAEVGVVIGEVVQPDVTEQEIDEIKLLAVESPEAAKSACVSRFEGDARDKCLFAAGLEANEAGLCEPIADLDKRDSCYFNIIFVTKDYTLCVQITDQNLRNTCSLLG